MQKKYCGFESATWFSWSCTILLLKVIDGDGILQDSSNKSQAFAYVWSDKNDPNLYGEWDFEVNMLYFIFWKFFFAEVAAMH